MKTAHRGGFCRAFLNVLRQGAKNNDNEQR